MPSQKESKTKPLAERVRLALREWRNADQTTNTLSDLYVCGKLQQSEQLTPRQATNRLLKDAIERLRESCEKDADLLESRFMDGVSAYKLANKYNMAESTLYAAQREALKRLAATIEQQEQHESVDHSATLYQRLEAASYEGLIGIEQLAEQVLEQATAPEPPWLVSLEGLGGIGKTSLAHNVLTTVIERRLYNEIGWVSARQWHLNLGGGLDEVTEPALTAEALIEKLVEQLMPEYATSNIPIEKQLCMLQTRLKERPHLIVVDNLETVVDVEELLPTLQKLTNPSRFILTSRTSLYARTNIFPFTIPELGADHSLAFIRQEAKWSNLSELAQAGDAELLSIFEIVGGNPLALRLVVGQNHVHSLDKILADISTAQTEASQNLHTYIYQSAWQSLDPHCQQVLMLIPLGKPSGDQIDVLAEIGEMSVSDVRQGLNKLVRLNLVDARGGINERRYSIHGLTRTFLHKHVLEWMSALHE